MCVCVNFLCVIVVCPSWAPYFGFNKDLILKIILTVIRFDLTSQTTGEWPEGV